ncbi:neutral zinc metallopeptidase [Lipingzhangella rawalii]|nr:neutral zinc metallopeptidase [Lipingzhangella rawalii]
MLVREKRSGLRPRPHQQRQRFSFGVLGVVAAGLGAIGLAGFVSAATIMEEQASGTALAPAAPASEMEPTGATSEIPEEGAGSEGIEHEILVANALYDTGPLDSSDCPAPDLDVTEPESMEAYLHELTDCLDDTWERQFDTADLAFSPPTRVYWMTEGQSPCGRYPAADTAAFYCRANQALYLGVEHIVENTQHAKEPEKYSMLLSHEYGHHVQGEAGILDYYQATRGAESTAERKEAWTRRSELQANCLGGAFLGSVAESFPIGEEERGNILEDVRTRGDVEPERQRTHGTPENGAMWTEHGLDRQDPAACNTWDARDELVE